MKPVVMEVNDMNAVILNEDGDFIRVRNRKYTVGQRIGRHAAKPVAGAFSKFAVAAASAAVLVVAGGIYAWCAPYTQVSMDVNPSIGLNFNIFNRLVGTTAFNADAEKILAQLNLLNADLPQAAESIVGELADQGFIAPDKKAELYVTTCSGDQTRSQDMLRDMLRTIDQKAAELRVQADVIGESVGEDVMTKAREYGVSPGKLRLAEKYALSTGDPQTVNLQNELNKPVKEIMKDIRANGGNPADNGKGYSGGDNTGTPDPSASPAPTGNGYAGGDRINNGANTPASTANGYAGGDKSDNGYSGGDKSDNGANTAAPTGNGYAGGDKSDNGYAGGDKSDNGSNTSAPGGNGYSGGDKSDNGYAGGASASPKPTPAATASPTVKPTCTNSPCPTCSPTGDANQNRRGQ